MVTASSDLLAERRVVRRAGRPGRAQQLSVVKRLEPARHAAVLQQQKHYEMRLKSWVQQHKECWPWSCEAARVPTAYEDPDTGSSPVLMRLSVRTALLMRHNQQLQRRLAALQAETDAVLRSFKQSPVATSSPRCSPGPPPSSLPSSPSYSPPSSPSSDYPPSSPSSSSSTCSSDDEDSGSGWSSPEHLP